MPKAVDIYVLEKKIGSGQFGDVFRGYSKIDGTDVAIKTISRAKVKGKFTELLDNEIKVLKSCKNNNIIRLIDIKKTANNIYLVLEYCNEGDLGAYLKQKKKLTQDEAVEYFVQILHAFQTLVKNKIMHRDFKLPNVLKHNGVIKLADFGFAKLLGTEDQQVQTILGSPLNMAPEVLDRQAYNSKADIWSIGVSFYQMIFGKVPYTASNIIDLLKKIRKDPVVFPHKIPQVIEDVIRRMLVVDPAKRIDWQQLFQHPVTRYLQDKLEQNLRQSLVGDKNDFKFNLSKFYIKTNMVIESPYEINTKQQLNNHIKHMMQKETPEHFKGKIIKRSEERAEGATKQTQQDIKGTQKQIKQDDAEEDQQKERIRKSQIMKQNWKRILFFRNVYAFFGHLAQDTIEHNYNIYGECLAFLLLKRVIVLLGALKKNIEKRKVEGVRDWEQFQKTAEHFNIVKLICQEEDIFNSMYEKLALKVLEKGTLSQFEDDLMLSGKFTAEETQKRIYVRVMKEYFTRIFSKKPAPEVYKHVIKLIDSVEADTLFHQDFDFSEYYSSFNQMGDEDLMRLGTKRHSFFVKNLAAGY